jgi:hypothetical protein
MGSHAYASSNVIGSGSGFTWSTGALASGLSSYLYDNRLDRRIVVGASVASGVTLIIDLGSAMQLVGIGVLNSNAAVQKTDAALKVEASSSATFAADINVAKAASTLYSSLAPRNKDHVLQWNANFTKRYWRLTWTWTGNVTNFAIGELFAFITSTQLSRRSVYGSSEGKKMWTASEQFQTGDRRGLKLGGPQRVLELNFSDLDATTRDQLDAMWQAANGNITPFLWVDSYEAVATAAASAEQNCVFGRLDEDELVFSQDDYAVYNPGSRGFRLRSAGREAGA